MRALGIAGLVALLSCGEDSVSMPCQSDTDCKGERVCVERYCGDVGGSSSGSGSPDDTSADSPLTGKYLWDVANCNFGTRTPLSGGRGILYKNVDREDDFTGEEEPDLELPFRYDDHAIYSSHFELRLITTIGSSAMNGGYGCITNYDDFMSICEASLEEAIRDDYTLSQCVLDQGNLYLAELNGKICGTIAVPDSGAVNGSGNIYSTFIQGRDEPWPGHQQCRESIVNREWDERLDLCLDGRGLCE